MRRSCDSESDLTGTVKPAVFCCNCKQFKVDREDHFWRPGFSHIIMFSKGTKSQISLKKLGVSDVSKTPKFEGFDRESRLRPF